MARAKTQKAGTKKSKTARKRSTTKKTTAKKRSGAQSTEPRGAVTVDRRSGRDRRATPDRRKKSQPVAVERRKIERRAKVNRRRQIDPTTCERDYTADEIEFMNALDEYKRSSGRMFPTCSEILEVVRKLGYEKRPQPAQGPATGAEQSSQSGSAPVRQAPEAAV